MQITYDETKRQRTLRERGLDFKDAGQVFAGDVLTGQDPRDYGSEVRFQTIGLLTGRAVFIAWTERDGSRRIISMRKANDEESKFYQEYLDRSG